MSSPLPPASRHRPFLRWTRAGRFRRACLLAFQALLAGGHALGGVILSEAFDYGDGPVTAAAGTLWSNTSGTLNQVDVASHALMLSGGETEDIQATLPGGPYSAGTLGVRMDVKFTALPAATATSGNGTFFAHLKDSGTNSRARLYAFTEGAAVGKYRLGISNVGGAVVPVPIDLELGIPYPVKLGWDFITNRATLAVDGFPAVIDIDAAAPLAITGFAFRQDVGIGSLSIDALQIHDQPVGNDHLGDAIAIDLSHGPVSVTGSTTSATIEPGERAYGDLGGPAKSVWYRLVIPPGKAVILSTRGSGFDTILSVFRRGEGNGVADLVEIAGNDDERFESGYHHSEVAFDPDPTYRSDYFVAVDGYDGDYGSFELHAAFEQPAGHGYETAFDFNDPANGGSRRFGIGPTAPLTLGSDGNLYGSTGDRWTDSADTSAVFKVTPAGEITAVTTFDGENFDRLGNVPVNGVVEGPDGFFYGFNKYGGANYFGTAFKVSREGAVTILSHLDSAGIYDMNRLMLGQDGSFYGTSAGGGTGGGGTVLRMTREGQFSTLWNFNGTNGRDPRAELIQAPSGTLLGTTSHGGTNDLGTVFKVAPGGGLVTLVNFTGGAGAKKGSRPLAALTKGGDGYYYGTTSSGGAGNHGTIFRVNEAGTFTSLFEFNGANGSLPNSAMILANDGNFYGTTASGGSTNHGTIFKLTRAGVHSVLVHFSLTSSEYPGAGPNGVVQGWDGHLYGTTTGSNDPNVTDARDFQGSVFRVSLDRNFVKLVDFKAEDHSSIGRKPCALVAGDGGTIYGATERGVTSEGGTIFRYHPNGEFGIIGDLPAGRRCEKRLSRGFGGDLVGASQFGGPSDRGFLFSFKRAEAPRTLEDLPVPEPGYPISYARGALTPADDFHYYGTATYGGAFDGGVVFRLSQSGQLTPLIHFTGVGGDYKGRRPQGRLAKGAGGWLYGITSEGGQYNKGTVFAVSTSGDFETLHEFGVDSEAGLGPSGGLLAAANGDLYGTTGGGGEFGFGTVFRIRSDDEEGGPGGSFTTLVEFTGQTGSRPGAGPRGELLEGPFGAIFGTTFSGGFAGKGTVFRISQTGEFTTLHEFQDLYDEDVVGDLVHSSDGNIYGALSGSANSLGSIFRIVLPGEPNVFSSVAKNQGSGDVQILASVNGRGSRAGFVVEYGLDEETFPYWEDFSPQVAGGFSTATVAARLSGLTKGVTYYYRILGTNDSGEHVSPVQSFKVVGEPLAIASPASQVTPGSARFNGKVNARHADAEVRFEWGTDGISFPNPVVSSPAVVTGSTETTVIADVGGLASGSTYHYRVVAENAGGISTSGTQSFTTRTKPVVELTEMKALTTTRASFVGKVDGRGSEVTQIRFEWGESGEDEEEGGELLFPGGVPALPGAIVAVDAANGPRTVTGISLPPPSALKQGTTYHCRLMASGPGGTGYSETGFFTLSVLSGLEFVFPPSLPAPGGVLTVNLSPPGVGSWRLAGELEWRASGTSATGLATGERVIEFRPVLGRLHPGDLPVTIDSTEPPRVIGGEDGEYLTPTGSLPAGGGMQVIFEPDTVRDAANAPRWHFPGDEVAAWQPSGGVRDNLLPGNYLIQCEDHGDWLPPAATVEIKAGESGIQTLTLVYTRRPTENGTGQQPVDYATVTGNDSLPFGYVGQLRSPTGHASGFAVKPKVVATAGHVVWDDHTKAAVSGLQWLFQRDTGVHEPVPLEPRGYFLASGYASAREGTDVVPGQGTARSQHYDYAALYFTDDLAARGGHSGFLASEGGTNEFLTAESPKILAGYSTDIANAIDRGRLHATPYDPAPSFALQQVGGIIDGQSYGTYKTEAIHGRAGSSGGPLFVLHGDTWYPAAIYLGGSGQTVVRAIDREVAALFDLAETRGNGGGNSHDGGRAFTASTGGTSDRGSLKVVFLPANLSGAKWTLNDSTTEHTTGKQRDRIIPGDYTITISHVDGYLKPGTESVTISERTLTTFTYTYRTSQQQWRYDHFGHFDITGADEADDADPDHDGRSNLDEYSADSDPKNASDFFRILVPTRTTGGFSVTVAGKKDRTYLLESSGELLPGPWAPHQTIGPLPADQPSLILTATPCSDPQRFYRVKVTAP